MLVDHIGLLFFPEHIIFRIIGRVSFPLFAFLIAEGFTKTSNVNKYLKRLSIFAVISQIPYMFFEMSAGITNFTFNILFTLALGVLTLLLMQKIKNLPMKILMIVAMLAVAHFAKFSYGAYGILSILGSYLFLKNRKAGMASLFVLPFLENLRLFLVNIIFPQLFAFLSIIPIYFYNGKPGEKISRWWFYWFYPAHMAILAVIFYIIK
jgi:hypothetical protein